MLDDRRIDAGAAFEGSIHGAMTKRDLRRPFGYVAGETFNDPRFARSLQRFRRHLRGPHPFARHSTTGHLGFTDEIWLIPQLGLDPAGQELGTVDPATAVTQQRSWLLRFVDPSRAPRSHAHRTAPRPPRARPDMHATEQPRPSPGHRALLLLWRAGVSVGGHETLAADEHEEPNPPARSRLLRLPLRSFVPPGLAPAAVLSRRLVSAGGDDRSCLDATARPARGEARRAAIAYRQSGSGSLPQVSGRATPR